jgi:hypothetical protein
MAGQSRTRAVAKRVPAPGRRGYTITHPEFEAENAMAVRHGAFSKRRTDPVARQLVQGLLASRPDLVAYPEEVWRWGRAEARALVLAEYLIDHPPWTEEGQAVAKWVSLSESAAERASRELGLTPASEAALARERAVASHVRFDLDAAVARGTELLEAREAEP